jgi:hypothetical protein
MVLIDTSVWLFALKRDPLQEIKEKVDRIEPREKLRRDGV